MLKNVKSVVSLVMLGATLVSGNVVSVKAKDIMGAVEDRLITVEPVYSDVFAPKADGYSVMINGKIVNDDLNTSGVTVVNNDVIDLTKKELFHLLNSYKHILEFGESYEDKTFYTYTGNELNLTDFDNYVYSLILDCKDLGLAESDSDLKLILDSYMDMVGVRDCILNFSLVSSDYREEQLSKLANCDTFNALGTYYYENVIY